MTVRSAVSADAQTASLQGRGPTFRGASFGKAARCRARVCVWGGVDAQGLAQGNRAPRRSSRRLSACARGGVRRLLCLCALTGCVCLLGCGRRVCVCVCVCGGGVAWPCAVRGGAADLAVRILGSIKATLARFEVPGPQPSTASALLPPDYSLPSGAVASWCRPTTWGTGAAAAAACQRQASLALVNKPCLHCPYLSPGVRQPQGATRAGESKRREFCLGLRLA